MSVKKKVFVKTYGCQMNVYDSQRMGEALVSDGYELTEKPDNADLILLNTCHIREKAAEKIYSELGRYKKLKANKPSLKIGVTGCVAQAEGKEIIKRQPLVDLVVGPQAYHRLPKMLQSLSEGKRSIDIEFPTEDKFLHLPKMHVTKLPPAAFLTVQEGCDKFCNFCVVPYTRGPEYSRPFNQIVEEAKHLVDNGSKEIILLGQNVNAYNFENFRLSNLILELEKLSGIERIRYTTSHPKDMTDDLIDVYKSSKKLMPLVHLPVQSGSDKILNLMNRKHTIKTYLEIFNKLKKINSNIEFSSDFIIAYPGEEKNDFEQTIKLIDEIKFINSFSFIFSPRPGTVAADLTLIDKKKSMERLEIVQQKLFNNQINMNKKLEDTTINVLVENRTDDKSKLFARSEYMTSVLFNGTDDLIGKIVKVKIKNSNQNTLFGEVVGQSNQRVA